MPDLQSLLESLGLFKTFKEGDDPAEIIKQFIENLRGKTKDGQTIKENVDLGNGNSATIRITRIGVPHEEPEEMNCDECEIKEICPIRKLKSEQTSDDEPKIFKIRFFKYQAEKSEKVETNIRYIKANSEDEALQILCNSLDCKFIAKEDNSYIMGTNKMHIHYKVVECNSVGSSLKK